MQFCTTCGRPKDEDAKFCVACGNQFPEPPQDTRPPDAQQTGPIPVPPPGWGSEPTQPGPHTGPGWGPGSAPPSPPPPFMAPPGPPMQGPPPQRQPPQGPPGWGPGVPDNPPPRYGLDALMGGGPATETVAGPGGDGGPRRRPPWLLLTVLLVIVLAGGGTAAALVLTSHHGGKNPQASGTTKAAPTTSTSPSPSQSPTTASPSPSKTPGLIQVAPGVAGNPQTPQIAAMLYMYFNAINSRDYFGYYDLLSPQQQQQTSQSQFSKGFATTKDGSETLQSLSPGPGGTTVAMVTFTSHQNPANSVDGHQSCTRWRISLYLQHVGNGYVIGKPPSSYRAGYSAC
jgi:hypothetical protein